MHSHYLVNALMPYYISSNTVLNFNQTPSICRSIFLFCFKHKFVLKLKSKVYDSTLFKNRPIATEPIVFLRLKSVFIDF